MRWPFVAKVALGPVGWVEARDVVGMVTIALTAPVVGVMAGAVAPKGAWGVVLVAMSAWLMLAAQAKVRLSWSLEQLQLDRRVSGVGWYRSVGTRDEWRVHLHHGLEGSTLMLLRGGPPLTLVASNVDACSPDSLQAVVDCTSATGSITPQVR